MRDAGNVFLILLRLELSGTLQLPSLAEEGGRFRRLQEDGDYRLLVGLLDSQMRSTSTPMEVLRFGEAQIDTYNRVLTWLEKLNCRYHGESGFVRHPDCFDRTAQKDVRDHIADIGCLIYELFQCPETGGLRGWLDEILTGRGLPEDRHVTIITNDFDIPWYWLKNKHVQAAPMLCEAVSLGTMQLKTPDQRPEHTEPDEEPTREEHFRALLINGSTDLPFASESLSAVRAALEAPMRGRATQFTVECIESGEELNKLNERYREQQEIVRQYKIVHFSGHYSGRKLMIKGEEAYDRFLQPFLKNSLVVLDGCSSSSGLKAWVDSGRISSSLINKGNALACVVTSLPVKDDPLVGPVLWQEFYREIRMGSMSVGQALVKARRTLCSELRKAGLPNPMPVLYQLCGSSTATLELESEEVRH